MRRYDLLTTGKPALGKPERGDHHGLFQQPNRRLHAYDGGAPSDPIVGAQNDTLLDGGIGTDTLNVGVSFSSTSDAQIANIENITLRAATTLNLANQTETFTARR